jgi:integrase
MDRGEQGPIMPRMPKSAYGNGTVYRRGRMWWIKGPGVKGQSAKTTDEKQAHATLKVKLAEAITGRKCGAERATVKDVLALVLKNYHDNEKRTTAHIQIQINKHLVPALGDIRIADLATLHIDRYKRLRKSEDGHGGTKTANATVNRELALLRRGLTLGRRQEPPMVVREFFIEMLPENNVRQGFLNDDEYPALLAALPDYLKTIFAIAYETGIRKEQLRQLNWPQVSFERRVIVWLPDQTKPKATHDIPFMGDMEQLLRAAFKDRNPACEAVFQIEGKRLGSFRKAWASSCTHAGVPGLLFHDLRRTAGRRLEDAGVPRTIAMRITGHKTESMYIRYAGVRNSRDLQEAARKIAIYREGLKSLQKPLQSDIAKAH